jgi:hypothetical protein
VHGGPPDGERFATPLDSLREGTMIVYLDGSYTISRDPISGRWRASPTSAERED